MCCSFFSSSNPEFLISAFAVLIAFSALIVSGIQTIIAKKTKDSIINHQKISVIPKLVFREEFTNTHDDGCGIMLLNNGLGPALIKRFRVYWNDKEHFSNSDLWDAIEFNTRYNIAIDWMNNGTYIRHDSHKWIIRIPQDSFSSGDKNGSNEQFFGSLLNNFRKQLKVHIEYESLYGEEKYTTSYPQKWGS